MEEYYKINNKKLFCKKIYQNTEDDKPWLVFLHEGLGSVSAWKDFPADISQKTGLNAFLYDREGYGKSLFHCKKKSTDFMEKEAFEVLPALLEKADIRKCILFGHSDGGSIAALFASEYPCKTAALITEAAHFFVEKETREGIKKLNEIFAGTDFKNKLSKYHENRIEDVFFSWSDVWLSEDFKDWNIENNIRKIDCPWLAVQGEKDNYATYRQLESVCRNAPHADIQIIGNCGHVPHFEAEDEIKKLVFGFIRGIL